MSELKIVGEKLNELIGKKIELAASCGLNVLLTGETGVGKELVAEIIHKRSKRIGDLEVVHCPALPDGLLEAGLFGYIRGSFTGGGLKDEEGIFLKARGGTVFLDEISEIPTTLQVKILRAVEKKKIRPVGAKSEVDIDVRIIAATNQDLDNLVVTGKFRRDLYYRLSQIRIDVPPLRERREDIFSIVTYFINHFSCLHKKVFERDLAGLLPLLKDAPWDGNVRELQSVIELETIMPFSSGFDDRMKLCTSFEDVSDAVLERCEENGKASVLSLKDARLEFDRRYLRFLMRICRGRVSEAAIMARKYRTDFYDLLKKYDIDLVEFRR